MLDVVWHVGEEPNMRYSALPIFRDVKLIQARPEWEISPLTRVRGVI